MTVDVAFWDAIPHTATGTAIADERDAHIRRAQQAVPVLGRGPGPPPTPVVAG
jgi:hypothetical protein